MKTIDELLDEREALRRRQDQIEFEMRTLGTERVEVRGKLNETDARLRELSSRTLSVCPPRQPT
jgi:chromosome segregation ATPase